MHETAMSISLGFLFLLGLAGCSQKADREGDMPSRTAAASNR